MDKKDILVFIDKNKTDFDKLNKKLQPHFIAALEEEDFMKNEKCWHDVFIASNFPTLVNPDADLDGRNLNDEQKALMRLAYRSEERYFTLAQNNRIKREWSVPFAFPHIASIPRWIGEEKYGMMEEMVEYEHENKKLHIPLWRALQLADENGTKKKFLNTMPLQKQMGLLFELLDFKYAHDNEDMYDVNSSMFMRTEIVEQVGAEYGDIAVVYLDKFVEEGIDDSEALTLFLTCVIKAGKEIKEEWEEFIPEWKLIHYIDYLPEDRKEAVIRKVVPKFKWATRTVNGAIQLLKKYPCQPLIDAIAQNYKDSDLPDRIALSKAMKAVSVHSEWHKQLQELLDALPKIDELFILSKTDASQLKNLSKSQVVQLENALNKWDGKDLKLKERYTSSNEEEHISNVIEMLEFCNSKGKSVIDLYKIGSDGTIFEAGTEKEIGSIVQDTLKMRSKKLKEALEYALYVRKEYHKS